MFKVPPLSAERLPGLLRAMPKACLPPCRRSVGCKRPLATRCTPTKAAVRRCVLLRSCERLHSLIFSPFSPFSFFLYGAGRSTA